MPSVPIASATATNRLAFHEQRHAHRDAEAQEIRDRDGIRRIETSEQRELAIVPARRNIEKKRERLDPQHDRGGDAAAERAERRQAEPAVHQHVADRTQQREAEHAEVHRRPRQAESFAQSAQREEQRKRGRTESDRMQEARHVGNQRRIDADRAHQHRTAPAHADPQQRAERDRKPQRLPKQRTDILAPLRAVQLRDRRRQRKHHADRADDGQRPHAGADRDRAERVRIEVTCEHRVDDVHADRRQLAEDQRQREAQHLSELAREARLSVA